MAFALGLRKFAYNVGPWLAGAAVLAFAIFFFVSGIMNWEHGIYAGFHNWWRVPASAGILHLFFRRV